MALCQIEQLLSVQARQHSKMHKDNYDTNSSIFSAEYKIPYQGNESLRIVEHLEESQSELEFLKLKLTEAYEKIEIQIRNAIKLQQQNDELWWKIEEYERRVNDEQRENDKLKQLIKTMIKNRKLAEQELQYTHQRHKKALSDQQESHQAENQKLHKQLATMRKQLEFMQEEMSLNQRALSRSSQNKQYTHELQIKISTLENEVRRLTEEKVTQANRFKHEIQCHERSLSPVSANRTTFVIDTENDMNKNNYNCESRIDSMHSKGFESKLSRQEEESIGRWKRNRATEKPALFSTNCTEKQLTDDQKLTKCQMNKKKIENQLIKIERLKRHTPQDRAMMQSLQKKLYELDSQISGLKRKIRQKY